MANPTSNQRGKSSFSLGGLLDAAGAVMAAATAAGFLAQTWWLFELTVHFRVQLAAGLALLAMLAGIRRRWRVAAIFSGFLLANLMVVLPGLVPEREPDPSGSQRLRAVLLNVHARNEQYAAVRDFLQAANPDLLLLEEVTPVWTNELRAVLDRYPHSVVVPRDDNFGVALFSRHPLTNVAIRAFGGAAIPSLLATASINGIATRLAGLHPLPPGTAENARLRNAHLAAAAQEIGSGTGPVIVLGDLNTSPWSPWFKRFLREARLKNSSQGRGLFASWPVQFWPLRIPLDHCLVSPPIGVAAKTLGPDVGSDHLPIVVDLLLPPAGPPGAKP
jgi:endonuclease/exonuclease/phosphatase (EEP) superfamily protein YafD